MEQTFVLIKPDAIEKNYTDLILDRLTSTGLNVVKRKMFSPNKEMLCNHYLQYKSDPEFLARLVNALLVGNIIALILEGTNAVEVVQKMKGKLGQKGTIRGDFGEGLNGHKNAIHSSDSVEEAKREIQLWFG